MKASDIVGLLRLIMYDVIGLIFPGAIFLFMIIRYEGMLASSSELGDMLKMDTTIHVSVVIFIAYIMGYLLQSITYVHFRLFDALGKRLLRKPRFDPRESDPGVSAADKFASSYFAESDFYRQAKAKIANVVGIDESTLEYADVSSLAFSLAGKEADRARDFRFKADLCGALSTLALINALVFIPFLALSTPGSSWEWYLAPGAIVAALFLIQHACELRVPEKGVAGNRESWHRGVARWIDGHWLLVISTIGLLLTEAVPRLLGSAGTAPYWLMIPASLIVWVLLLFRQCFYSDIGAKIIFHIAIARIANRSTKASSLR